jgi:acetoin utilization deacetylase AcuC-like enzyme
MVLYNASNYPALSEFGISIPIFPSNNARALDALQRDPSLEEIQERWLTAVYEPRIGPTALELVHAPEYVARLQGPGVDDAIVQAFELIDRKGNYHRYNPRAAFYPLSHLYYRALDTTSGTVQSMRLALRDGHAFFLGGGMHHAKWDYGEGFCIINDVVVAPRLLQAEGLIRTAWIIDLDAHKGDGTAALTREDSSLTTLSIHMAGGWPLDKPERREDGTPEPSHLPSDIDIPIERGEEGVYVERLREGLQKLDRYPRPDVALVLYGADPYERDALPSAQELQLTSAQMLERDRAVYSFLAERGIPRAYVNSGGYGYHVWEVISQFLEWYLYTEYC